MKTIINTVGTSLIRNAQTQLQRQDLDLEALIRYLYETGEERGSAESNALSRLLQREDRLIFLHSDTSEGHTSAQALTNYYRKKGYETEISVIPGMDYSEVRFKIRGLRSLVDSLVSLIHRERDRGREVVVNATGGFKAEIAYATLVGLLFNVPVYYIHEVFRDIIEMPATPICWDYSLLADYQEFIEWLEKDTRRTAKVESRLKGMPDSIRLLLAEEDGYTLLSPTGDVFYKAYLERMANVPPVYLSSAARREYQTAESTLQMLFSRTLNKLRLPELRNGGSGRVHNSDCLVFPRGDRPERVFYTEEEDRICVCELARHQENYERLLKRGVWRNQYHEFQEWGT